MVGGDEFAAIKRQKMVRKHKVRKQVQLTSVREPGQSALTAEIKKHEFDAYQWKGGMLARKNVPDEEEHV